MNVSRFVILFTFASLLILTSFTSSGYGFPSTNDTSVFSNFDSDFEECTSIIVTGDKAKNGRAILMKNRDSAEINNKPEYHQSSDSTYAFVAVNSMWMGINEKGLAVMNTAMLDLAEGSTSGASNGMLNRLILEICENVSDVVSKLETLDSPIGPPARNSTLRVATCIGVVDNNGEGAFIEVSNSQSSVEYVVDGYQSRANHPRTYPGLAGPPAGRDQYALDALDRIYDEKGEISWEDVAQCVSRYVRDRELGDSNFPINGEICNDHTVSSMVAVSGDNRYDGRLNIMWCEYGRVPMVGVFLPSMVHSGIPPAVLNHMVGYTIEKKDYAAGSSDSYDPSKVQEIQEYAFAAEGYSFDKYDELVEDIPDNLSDTELAEFLKEFIDHTVSVSTYMYVNETSEIPEYSDSSIVTTTSTTTTGSTETTQTSTTTQTNELSIFTNLAVGFSAGIFVVALIFVSYRRMQA